MSDTRKNPTGLFAVSGDRGTLTMPTPLQDRADDERTRQQLIGDNLERALSFRTAARSYEDVVSHLQSYRTFVRDGLEREAVEDVLAFATRRAKACKQRSKELDAQAEKLRRRSD